MKSIIWTLLLSATPLIEQRGAIPVAIFANKMPLIQAFLICYIGSLLPAPFILLLFNKIYKWLKQKPKFDRITNLIDSKISKNKDNLEKYKEIGLITFIAIPLPTTGVWTGSAIAAFLGLDFKRSMVCAAIGAAGSATLITIICAVFPKFFGL